MSAELLAKHGISREAFDKASEALTEALWARISAFYRWDEKRVRQTVTPKLDMATLMVAPAGVGKSVRAKAERRLMAQERAAARSNQAREGKLTAGGPGMPQDGQRGQRAPMQQPGAQAQPAGNSGRAQGPLGNARRGFGRDANGNPFRASR